MSLQRESHLVIIFKKKKKKIKKKKSTSEVKFTAKRNKWESSERFNVS